MMTSKVLLSCVVLTGLAGSLASGSSSLPNLAAPRSFVSVHGAKPQPATATTRPEAGAAVPTLRGVPSRVVIDNAQPATWVTLVGDHFDPGVTVRLNSTFHFVVFGSDSIQAINPTTLRFDAALLKDGVYTVYVRGGSGRHSNEMTMAVLHK
jgi:hypothetical protein